MTQINEQGQGVVLYFFSFSYYILVVLEDNLNSHKQKEGCGKDVFSYNVTISILVDAKTTSMTHSKFPTSPPRRAPACLSQSRDFVNSLDTSQASVFSAFDFFHDSNIAGKKGFRFIRKCNYSLTTARIEYTHNEEEIGEPKVWYHS